MKLAKHALLVSLVLVGCDVSRPTSTPASLFFPVLLDQTHAVLMTRISGTLAIDGSCLILRPDRGRPVVVIWPPGYQLRSGLLGLVVVDTAEGLEAAVGAEVTLGGGVWFDSGDGEVRAEIEALIGAKVPDECHRGRYWLGGLLP